MPEYSETVTHTIDFGLSTETTNIFGREITSSLEFNASNETENTFNRSVTTHLDLSATCNREATINRGITDSLNLREDSDFVNQQLDSIEFTDLVESVREAFREVISGINFNTDLKIINSTTSNIVFNQIIEILKSKGQFAGVNFNHQIIREILSRRTITSHLRFGQIVRAYRFPASGGGGSYGRVVGGGTYPPGFTPLPNAENCNGQPCNGTQISFNCPPYSLTLKLPVGHSKKIVFNKIDRITLGQQLENHQNSFPILTVLRYSFSNLNSIFKNNFISYFKATAGQEMTLIDECNDKWYGVIITSEVSIVQDAYNRVDPNCPADGGYYSFEFEFEGVKL